MNLIHFRFHRVINPSLVYAIIKISSHCITRKTTLKQLPFLFRHELIDSVTCVCMAEPMRACMFDVQLLTNIIQFVLNCPCRDIGTILSCISFPSIILTKVFLNYRGDRHLPMAATLLDYRNNSSFKINVTRFN